MARRARLAPLKLGDRIVLEYVEASLNARRFYTMTVLPDPQLALYPALGGAGAGDVPVLLVCGFGRDRVTHVWRKRFASLELAVPKWRALLRLRERHGYRRIG